MNPVLDLVGAARSALTAFVMGWVWLTAWTAPAAGATNDLRQRVLAGEAIVFKTGQSEAERVIPAPWLAEAARKGIAVNVSHAVIAEPLDLRQAAITNGFRLHHCVVKSPADCSFAIFERGFDFTDSQFAADADFTGTVTRRAALARGTTFSGAAVFTDATAEDVFQAQGAAFLGKEVKFNRATFLKSAGFGPMPGQPAASFGGNVTFEAARFGGALDLNRVRFGSGTNSQVVFKELRCEAAANFRGAEFRGVAQFGAAVFLSRASFGAEDEGPGANPPARFHGPVDFTGAQFGGEADFIRVPFLRAGPVSFEGCTFKDRARFTQAQFAGGGIFAQARLGALADFESVRFNGTDDGPAVSFQDSEIGGRANFANAQFNGTADYRNLHFVGEAAFNGAVFAAEALFTYAKFDHSVSFAELRGAKVPAASFADATIFGGAHFGSDAFFEGVQFTATNRPVTFSAAQFGGETAFDGAKFSGDANFVRAHFHSAATFTSAQFLNRELTAQFSSIKAGKSLDFTGARFAGNNDFTSAEVVGPVQFAGVVFERDAIFNAMHVQRHAIFGPIGTNSPTQFRQKADFIASHIGGLLDLAQARFDGDALFRGATLQRGLVLSWRPAVTGAVFAAEFRARADFRNVQAGERVELAGVTFHDTANFDATKWDVPLVFDEVRFRKGASLAGAACPQGADFSNARFEGPLNLSESTFRTLRLTAQDKWTDGPIELRGATYEHFEGSVDAVLEGFTGANRQVLTRLEKVLRQMGRDDEADQVYLERQRRERVENWNERSFGEWIFGVLYGTLGNYGVRPYRLLVFSAVLIWLGSLVFQLPGAVVRKDKPQEELSTARLSRWDALALSVCYFLPVEFPLEELWVAGTAPLTVRLPGGKKAVQLRPAAIANFVLRMSGWIVVPLALAAVTGMLKVSN